MTSRRLKMVKTCESCQVEYRPFTKDQKYCHRGCYIPHITDKSVSPEKRFWKKVNKNGPTMPHMSTPCWMWLGWQRPGGYGQIKVGKYNIAVHRFSYELHNGSIPDGLLVCHDCDNRMCVNPDHLWPGTQADNNADKEQKGRGVYPKGRIVPLELRPKGESHGCAKLTKAQVIEIRRRHAQDKTSNYRLGIEFNVNPGTIHDIVNRKTWKHIR